MDQSRLQELLRRLRNEMLSNKEMDELNDWYHKLNGGREDFEAWVNQYGSEDALKSYMYNSFTEKLNAPHKPTQRKIWYSAAAVLFIAFMVGALAIKHKNLNKAQSTISLVKIKNSPLPGSNKAMLILANGSSVQLSDNKDSTLKQAGVNVAMTGKGKLVYNNQSTDGSPAIIAYNTIITPRGGQYQLVLQDGTKVWLNSDSYLRYPVKFRGNERRVELKGEAYFEVVHNNTMPFKVVTGEVITTDIGTHFNIKAYDDDSKISATLLEGSVAINDLITHQAKLLIPGKEAKILKGNGNINIQSARIDEVMSWKNGYFIFDNENIRAVMQQISRWYDVDVTYNLSKDVRVGGTFSRSENLPELLKSFELIGNIHCELKERRIIVSN